MVDRSSAVDVRRDDVSEYLAHLADQGMSGVTRARKLAAVPDKVAASKRKKETGDQTPG